MKPLLLSTLLVFSLLTGVSAQSLRVYPVGRQIAVFAPDSSGYTFDPNQISIRWSQAGGFISVSYQTSITTLTPAQFLTESGAPYGSTVQAAKTAYNAALRAATLSGGGSSGSVAATLGTAPQNSTDYTGAFTVTTSNLLSVTLENIGNSASASFSYAGKAYSLLPGEQRSFTSQLDLIANKYVPFAALSGDGTASPIRVTTTPRQ